MSQPAPKRIALFGGTFDPIHNGHLDLVEKAKTECDLDQVIFIPCAQSPFKSDQSTVADAETRASMIENALTERDWNSWASVSRYEIERPPPSYSWQTAEHFAEVYPNADLLWILGTDQWDSIDRWAEPEKLRQLLSFIVVSRNGTKVVDRAGWSETPIQFEHPASSTAIRSGKAGTNWIPSSNSKTVKDVYKVYT